MSWHEMICYEITDIVRINATLLHAENLAEMSQHGVSFLLRLWAWSVQSSVQKCSLCSHCLITAAVVKQRLDCKLGWTQCCFLMWSEAELNLDLWISQRSERFSECCVNVCSWAETRWMLHTMNGLWQDSAEQLQTVSPKVSSSADPGNSVCFLSCDSVWSRCGPQTWTRTPSPCLPLQSGKSGSVVSKGQIHVAWKTVNTEALVLFLRSVCVCVCLSVPYWKPLGPRPRPGPTYVPKSLQGQSVRSCLCQSFSMSWAHERPER